MGTWAIFVYAGLGQLPAGALTTPTNTMFQFEPVQLPHCVLREIHCCCVAEFTFPSTSTSDIQPPLDQPLFWLSFMPPRTCMRRKGTAWETAHWMVPLLGSMEKPSAPR